MEKNFPEARSSTHSLLAVMGATVLAGSLFFLIPITQSFMELDPEITEIREVVTIDPPKVQDIPPPDEMEEEVQEEIPQMREDLQELTLSQLELSLNPGIGDALAMGIQSKDFNTRVDVVSDIKKIFVFDDLAQAPQILSVPRINYPRELQRRGINEGQVVLLIEINEKGKAKVLDIISSAHPTLEQVALKMARQVRFSIPKINGEAVTVRGEWPITLVAPR